MTDTFILKRKSDVMIGQGLTSNEAIAIGDPVLFHSNGKMRKPTALGEHVIATALTKTDGANEHFTAEFFDGHAIMPFTAGGSVAAGDRAVLTAAEKAVKYEPVPARSGMGSFTLAVNATGGGAVSVVIAGHTVAIAPGGADTPEVSAVALANAIMADATVKTLVFAWAVGAVVYVTSIRVGLTYNYTTTCASTDATQTITASGAVMVGGVDVEYDEGAVIGRCLHSAVLNGTVYILTGIK